MDLNAPFVNFVLAAYGVAGGLLLAIATSIIRAYRKACDES
jgi:hypothetical protein